MRNQERQPTARAEGGRGPHFLSAIFLVAIVFIVHKVVDKAAIKVVDKMFDLAFFEKGDEALDELSREFKQMERYARSLEGEKHLTPEEESMLSSYKEYTETIKAQKEVEKFSKHVEKFLKAKGSREQSAEAQKMLRIADKLKRKKGFELDLLKGMDEKGLREVAKRGQREAPRGR